MSFSSKVKEELSKQISSARHCRIAEITAIISMCGKITISADDRYSLKINTENVAVARKYFTLIKKTFNINTEIAIRRNEGLKKNKSYSITIRGHKDSIQLLKACKLLDDYNEINENMSANNIVIQNACCKRAFIRGAFLATGSISDPEKQYHFEIVCTNENKANQLKEVISTFGIEAKIVQRKKYFVVYIKEGSQIVDILNVMEAHVSLMELENVRILKEMRNSVNRQVNCETANINKTVSAAVKQIEDIKYIESRMGLGCLSPALEEIARKRLEYPEATLKELGNMLTPSVGKSGVNHRLRKLSEMAQELRDEDKEEIL